MRTSQPGPPGHANAALWVRWLLPAAVAAGFVALLVLPRGAAPGPPLTCAIRPLAPGRGARPARRADGRAARHRQDAAGPRGRRGGPRPVLLGVRVGFRGDVRRPRRGPGPGPVRAGPRPRPGQALGLTETLPADDRRLYGERYLADTLAVRLGGRAAERLIRGEASTGAADDLASATALATQMVREFGLSQAIGPVSYPGPPGGHPALAQRGYSEHTQWLLDQEVAAILAGAETRARDLLTTHRDALAQLTAALLEHETVTGDQVRAIAQAEITTAIEPHSSTKRISR
jgi:hypothetical protein